MSGVPGDSGLASVTRLINGLATCIEGFSREGLAGSFWCLGLQAAALQSRLPMKSLPGPSSRFASFLLFLLECETISSFHSGSMAGRLMNLSPAPKPRLPRMSAVHSEVPRQAAGGTVGTNKRHRVVQSSSQQPLPLLLTPSSTAEMTLHLQLLLRLRTSKALLANFPGLLRNQF